MDFQNFISVLQSNWGIIVVIFGFCGYVLFQRDNAKKIILSLMLRLEKEAEALCLQTGDDKLQFMLEKGYQLLPAGVRLIISQNSFNEMVKGLYNKAKGYLIVQKPKEENANNTSINEPVSDSNNLVNVINSETTQTKQTDLNVIPVINETAKTVIIPTIESNSIQTEKTVENVNTDTIQAQSINNNTNINVKEAVSTGVTNALSDQAKEIAKQAVQTVIQDAVNEAVEQANQVTPVVNNITT